VPDGENNHYPIQKENIDYQDLVLRGIAVPSEFFVVDTSVHISVRQDQGLQSISGIP